METASQAGEDVELSASTSDGGLKRKMLQRTSSTQLAESVEDQSKRIKGDEVSSRAYAKFQTAQVVSSHLPPPMHLRCLPPPKSNPLSPPFPQAHLPSRPSNPATRHCHPPRIILAFRKTLRKKSSRPMHRPHPPLFPLPPSLLRRRRPKRRKPALVPFLRLPRRSPNLPVTTHSHRLPPAADHEHRLSRLRPPPRRQHSADGLAPRRMPSRRQASLPRERVNPKSRTRPPFGRPSVSKRNRFRLRRRNWIWRNSKVRASASWILHDFYLTDRDLRPAFTGEEDEQIVHQVRVKLYVMEGDTWKERGTGSLHLNIPADGSPGARLGEWQYKYCAFPWQG